MPKENKIPKKATVYTGFGNLDNYIKETGAVLEITSMVVGHASKISFPAFVTDISQNFSSTWNTEEVYGRMDPIALFQNTKRQISISLEIPSMDRTRGKENLNKCATVAAYMYPGYTVLGKSTKAGGFEVESTVISKSPLVKVRLGNLIRSMNTGGGLLGYFDSFSFTPVLESGMYAAGYGQFYPKVISLNFSFNVLHQSPLGWENNGYVPGDLPDEISPEEAKELRAEEEKFYKDNAIINWRGGNTSNNAKYSGKKRRLPFGGTLKRKK